MQTQADLHCAGFEAVLQRSEEKERERGKKEGNGVGFVMLKSH